MLTDAVRRRLEALNRQPMSQGSVLAAGDGAIPPAHASPAAVERSDQIVRRAATRPAVDRGAATQAIACPRDGWLEQAEVVETSSGEHLRMRLRLEALWPRSTELEAAARRRIARSATRLLPPHPEHDAFVRSFPTGPLLLDLETCGLAGSALFLIGLLRHVDQAWTVELLFARSYAEERAILESLWRIVREHETLVTFNGKSFDWPMVHDRSTMHHLRRDERNELVHFDLLHHARRRWRGRLPNCKLQTLEQFVCGRRREGDLPGGQIPAAYHHFVRTGKTRDIEAVLHHNAVDLATLWELALRLAT